MENNEIYESLGNLYGYLLAIPQDIIETAQAKQIIDRICAFLANQQIQINVGQYRFYDEKSILMEINDFCFDLLEELDDLDEFDSYTHLYSMIQQLNSDIIELLTNTQDSNQYN